MKRNVKINFLEVNIFLKTYDITITISITKWVKLIYERKFTIIVVNTENKTYIVNLASFVSSHSYLDLFCHT